MSKNEILLGMAGSIVAGFFLLVNGVFFTSIYETMGHSDYAMAATTSTTTVSAVIIASISCSTNIATTSFTTWTDTSIKTSSPNASSTMACGNSAGGCTLYVKDVGNAASSGLATTSPAYLIPSPNAAFAASATLSDGTEGYGIKAATTTVGSGAAFGIPVRYRNTGANDIGGLQITNTAIATTTSTTTGREILVTHMAAIAGGTPSGLYSDIITYECTGN